MKTRTFHFNQQNGCCRYRSQTETASDVRQDEGVDRRGVPVGVELGNRLLHLVRRTGRGMSVLDGLAEEGHKVHAHDGRVLLVVHEARLDWLVQLLPRDRLDLQRVLRSVSISNSAHARSAGAVMVSA